MISHLPRLVRDWPADARRDFQHVKNELWKWAKKSPNRDRTGLALIAYEAVKQVYENNEKRVITYDNQEDMWTDLKRSVRSQTSRD